MKKTRYQIMAELQAHSKQLQRLTDCLYESIPLDSLYALYTIVHEQRHHVDLSLAELHDLIEAERNKE